MLQVN
jgi:NADH-ubiquinone oxidoreductase chain 6